MFVGVYVVLVLKEFRETIQKANIILDNVESLSQAVTNPVSALMGIATAATQGFKVVKSIRTLRGDIEEDEE